MARHKLGFEGLAAPNNYTILRQYDGFGWLNTAAMDKGYVPGSGPGSGPANAVRGDAAAFNGGGSRLEFRSLNGAEFTFKKAIFAGADDAGALQLEFLATRDGQIVARFELDLVAGPQKVAFRGALKDVDAVSIQPVAGDNWVFGMDNLVISSDAVW